MSNIREIAVNFEAVKTSMSQNKDGMILRLAIHPNDVPTALIQDWVGTRYMVALVKLDDDDKPVASDATESANRAIKSAAMLCKDPSFHKFMQTMYNEHPGWGTQGSPDADTTAILRDVLGVDSRADMKTNADALQRFEQLREEYRNFLRTYVNK